MLVSDAATVYHPERGQLCYFDRRWDCVLSYPIQFKNKAAAMNWIKSGTIAEIQEGLSMLAVGFSMDCFQKRVPGEP